MTSVVLLIERCLAAKRRSASDRADAAEKAQEREEHHTIDAMREEARDIFKKAIVSGVTSLASGAAQLGASVISFQGVKGESEAAKIQKDAASFGTETGKGFVYSQKGLERSAEAGRVAADGRALSTIGSGIGAGSSILGGSGKIAEGAVEAECKGDQVEQAEHRNAGEAYGRRGRREEDAAREFHELETKTLDRLEQLLQAEHQGRLSLIERA
jgi:hypothetical protein